MEITITTKEVVGKGWIAFAPEARATAQGATESEAKDNLLAIFKTYPDLLAEARAAHSRADQAWFWTAEWQKGERRVDEHVAAGRVTVADDVDDFLAAMDGVRRRKQKRPAA